MNLKVGDKVQCTQSLGSAMIKGNIYTVIDFDGGLAIRLSDTHRWYLPDRNTKYYFKKYNASDIINTEQDYYKWLASRLLE